MTPKELILSKVEEVRQIINAKSSPTTSNTVVTISGKNSYPNIRDTYTEEEQVDLGILDMRIRPELMDKLPVFEYVRLMEDAHRRFDFLVEKVARKRAMKDAKEKAQAFKDYQKRSQAGQLTAEELAVREAKRKERSDKFRGKI